MKTFTTLAVFCLIYLAAAEIDLPPLNLQDINFDDFAPTIKGKCDNISGEGTYDKLKASTETLLQKSVAQFGNISKLGAEIEEAKKTGSMDEVFGKYCRKRSQLTDPVKNFTDNLESCLNDDEKDALNITINIIQQLGDFICYRDGDRIAMFIAEGGVECIKAHTEGVKNCVNATLKIQPLNSTSDNPLPNLLIDKKKCDDLGKLQTCVVEELEKCSQSTPANIVDALFKFIKRAACNSKPKRSVTIHSVFKRNVNATQNEVKNRLLKLVKEKCDQNKPKGGYENFMTSGSAALDCWNTYARTSPAFNASSDQMKKRIANCMANFVEGATDCLPKEEKYAPKFGLEIINNIVDFAYKNEEAVTNLPKTEFQACFKKLQNPTVQAETAKCLPNLDDSDLRKGTVCSKLNTGLNCLSKQINTQCTLSIKNDKLIRDGFDAVLASCQQRTN